MTSAEKTTRVGLHPEVVCTGLVNGMHELDSGGAYVKLVATWPGGDRDVLVISRGAARILSDEIDGVL